MNTGKFKKHHIPFNKGMRGIHLSPRTEFKKGINTGKAHPSWKGGIQQNKNDCVYLYKGVGKRVRRPVAVWTEHRGSVPVGFVVYHIDGNKNNDCINNLTIVSRSELIKLNNRRKIIENRKKALAKLQKRLDLSKGL